MTNTAVNLKRKQDMPQGNQGLRRPVGHQNLLQIFPKEIRKRKENENLHGVEMKSNRMIYRYYAEPIHESLCG